jgi:hypothetical protein
VFIEVVLSDTETAVTVGCCWVPPPPPHPAIKAHTSAPLTPAIVYRMADASEPQMGRRVGLLVQPVREFPAARIVPLPATFATVYMGAIARA